MAATLSILNVAGISQAELELSDKMTILGGDNGAGKTSLLLALRAALTGQAALGSGTIKSDGSAMVHDGAKAGSTKLEAEGGVIVVTWPDCKVQARGAPWQASPVAAGTVRFLDLAPKERARLFTELFRCEPGQSSLAEALAAEGVKLDAALWRLVQQLGYDGTYAQVMDLAREHKARWCQVTGRPSYGAEIAEAWQAEPDAGGPAINIRAARTRLDGLAQDLDGKQADLGALESEQRAAREQAQQLAPPAAATLACPCCGKPALIQGGALAHAAEISPAELQKRALARDDLLAEISSRQAEINQTKADITLLQEGIAALQGQLQAADALAKASKDNLAKRTGEAQELHRQVQEYLAIAKVIGPSADGLRAKEMDALLVQVNAELAEMGEAAGLGPLAFELIDEARGVRALGVNCQRPAWLRSGAQRWAINAIVQLAIARRDGSSCIILDGADILKDQLRRQFFTMLAEQGIAAVIGMAASSPAGIPNLASRSGYGVSYWVQDGQVRPLAEVIAEQAAA